MQTKSGRSFHSDRQSLMNENLTFVICSSHLFKRSSSFEFWLLRQNISSDLFFNRLLFDSFWQRNFWISISSSRFCFFHPKRIKSVWNQGLLDGSPGKTLKTHREWPLGISVVTLEDFLWTIFVRTNLIHFSSPSISLL